MLNVEDITDYLVDTKENVRKRVSPVLHNLGDYMFGLPDVILIGEIHTSDEHKVEQADLIRNYRPEFVLHEGFNTTTPEDNEPLITNYSMSTILDFSRVTGIALSDLGIHPEIMSNFERYCNKKLEERIEDNEYFLLTDLTRDIDRINNDKITDPHEIMKVLQLHNDRHEEQKQELYHEYRARPKTFIDFLRTPLYKDSNVREFFSECFGNEYDHGSEVMSNKMCSAINNLLLDFKEELSEHKVFHAIADVQGKLVGCDIDKKIPKLNLNDQSTESTLLNHRKNVIVYVNRVNGIREETMGKRIVKYAHLRESRRPIIAIDGRIHANSTGVLSVVEDAGLRYRVIKQGGKKDPGKAELYADSLGR